MGHTSTTSIRLARGVAAALFALSVYRAVTQAVTPGEAANYNHFIGPGWTDAFATFDVNNHVLNTLLCRFSTVRLHTTEIWLRLPSLVFGIVYLWAAWRLARRFGKGPLFLATFGLLTLNPMVIDGLSEARGYGMGLACLCWALVLLLESNEGSPSPRLNYVGVLLGLSVVACLANLAPACALVVVYLVWSRGRGWALAEWLTLTVFLFLVLPLNHAEWRTLAVGATSLRQTMNEICFLSFGTSSKVLAAAVRVVVALLTVAGMAAATRFRKSSEGGLVVLTGGTLALSVVLVKLAHSCFDAAFPLEGSVYLIPLCALTFIAIVLKFNSRYAQVALLVIAALVVGRYLTELPVGMYASGRDLAGGRELAKTLRKAAFGRAVNLGVSPAALEIVNFYKSRYRQGNWEGIGQGLGGDLDFYVIAAADGGLAGHKDVLYKDGGLTLFGRH